jgi:hypothetical protein
MRCFALSAFLAAVCTVASAQKADFYVAPQGNDRWSGHLDAPNSRRTDGPFATPARAQTAVRELLRTFAPGRARPILVELRGGVYTLTAPLVFLPEDSGTPQTSVTYAAYPGEEPILSGGVPITGWKTDGQGRWTVTLPEVKRGAWNFAQLWVDGQRRFRPRLPKQGYYTIAEAVGPSPAAQRKGYDRFQFRPGDLNGGWSNQNDIEALCFQTWSMARLPIAEIDTHDENVVTFTGHTAGLDSWAALPKGNRYLLENVKEALSVPGEWYLDRPTGELTYLPLPGERIDHTHIVAPRLDHLVELRGAPNGKPAVSSLVFRGLQFLHTNWVTPREGHACPQAEVDLSAAITAVGAFDCQFLDCTIAHTGAWAIEWGEGCQHNIVQGCALTDLGAGGVKIGETAQRSDESQVASENVVVDSLISGGGRLHPAAVGVWIGESDGNKVYHNIIEDLYYTGVSVGWTWGYGPSLCNHNLIADNEIAHLGQGVLSDMGGVYTLGLSPHSVVRHNLIHDVNAFSYGGWGIYFDEGTTGMVAMDNVVYDTKTGGFHQHYGQDNVVQNNIFALARQDGQIIRTRAEDHRSFTFEHNIVYYKTGGLLGSNWSGNNYQLDYNLYWNAAGETVTFSGLSLTQWQQKGQDLHSVIADPEFVDPEHGDFRFRSPEIAQRIGFRPILFTDFGPRIPRLHRRPHPPVPRAFPETGQE